MQEFRRKALYAFVLILLADALLAAICVERSYLSQSLLPPGGDGDGTVHWRKGFTSTLPDPLGIRVDEAVRDRLQFDLNLPVEGSNLIVSADLLAVDGTGRPALADWARYGTLSFVATCSPANTLVFVASIHDEHLSQSGNFLTYTPATSYFSCNEQGMPVSLDLTRLTIPEWWFTPPRSGHPYQDYRLDRVARLVFGASWQSPRGRPAHVEISKLTLHGRDVRYIGWLLVVVTAGWGAYAAWFFRANARAITLKESAQPRQDLPSLEYRQLTLVPHRDKEKASLLQFIEAHFTDPELDLERVCGATALNRSKINDMLKSEFGMTFTSYLNKLRLEEAARRLTGKGDTTVVEIAYAVGYTNASYFSKLFKEAYGCTPKAFRTLADQPQQPAGDAQETASS